MATTGRKRVGQGKAKKASKHKAGEPVATEAESAPADRTQADSEGKKQFPQVGDGIRTHRGAASGWASGVVKYAGENGAIIAAVDGYGDLGLENGQYEPSDGNLPADRFAASTLPLPISHPVIGPPGPVLGVHPSAAPHHSGAGQTLPQGRHLKETFTGTDDAGKKPNPGPSMTAGPAPAEGEQFGASGDAGAPEAHPPEKVVKRMEKEKEARKELDKQTPRPR